MEGMVLQVKIITGQLNESGINIECLRLRDAIRDIKFPDSETCVIIYKEQLPPRNG